MSTSHSARQPGAGTGEAGTGEAGTGEAGWQAEQDRMGAPGPMPGGPRLSREVARGAWPAFLAAGMAALVVGVLLLAWPSQTLTLVAILIGISLVAAGLLRLVRGFTEHQASGGARAADLVIGLLAIIVGLYLLRNTGFTIITMAIIVGIFWIIHGVADLAAGMSGGPVPGRGLMITTGVLSLLAGLLVLFWPTISLTVLIAVMGIWLVVYGVALMGMAVQFRRAARSSGGSGPMAAA